VFDKLLPRFSVIYQERGFDEQIKRLRLILVQYCEYQGASWSNDPGQPSGYWRI